MASAAMSNWRLLGLVAAVSLLWGINWPFMKLAVTEIPPWTFRSICVVCAGSILLVLGRLTGEPIGLPRRLWPALILVSVFAVTGWHMLTAYGLLVVGGGRAAIIAYTMPLWAALLSVVVLGERLTARRLAALLIGMAAMGLLLIPDLGRLEAAPIGMLLITGAAIAWAVGIVATKAVDWPIGTLALTGWQLLVGGVPIVLIWPVAEGVPDLSRVSPIGWLSLAYVVLVALVFCFSTHIRLIRMLPATVAALSTLAIPVVGLLSSALLLGEPIGGGEVLALILVLAALSLVLIPAKSPRP